MSQNTSSAVMAQRREPPDSLDFFPTPPWATRALIEHVLIPNGWAREDLAQSSVWEPACGEGDMARPLAEYFGSVRASDIHPYGYGEVQDFLAGPLLKRADAGAAPDWFVTNPPFRLGLEFVLSALAQARCGGAIFVRTQFLEAGGRHKRLYARFPPLCIAQFVERVPIVQGRVDPGADSATAYCWIVWRIGYRGATEFKWIAPCREDLERPGDYRRDYPARSDVGGGDAGGLFS